MLTTGDSKPETGPGYHATGEAGGPDLGIRPAVGQERVEFVDGRVSEASQRGAEVSEGIDAVPLTCGERLKRTAAVLPPLSEPRKSQFLRSMATRRSAFSLALYRFRPSETFGVIE